MSKVGIFGAGWVGLVTGVCFAELGHDVVIRDVVPEKIEALRERHACRSTRRTCPSCSSATRSG
jgi:UDP-glucose 6-dehydrogenase